MKRDQFHSCSWCCFFLALLATAVLLGCAAQEAHHSAQESGQSRLLTSADVASSAGQSATGQSGVADGQSTADLTMSNGYRVGPDGKLLQPDKSHIKPPVLPDEAKQRTAAGAEAFAKYYLQVHVYTWRMGDTSLMREIYSRECDSCLDTVQRIDDYYAAGGWSDIPDTLEIQVREVITYENSQSGSAEHSIIVHFTMPSYTFYQKGALSTTPPTPQTVAVDCCWIDNQWKACGLNAKTN